MGVSEDRKTYEAEEEKHAGENIRTDPFHRSAVTVFYVHCQFAQKGEAVKPQELLYFLFICFRWESWHTGNSK